MSSRFIPAISRGWLSEELYGWRQAPTIAACRVPFLYAKAMLATSSAPGHRERVSGMLSAHFAGAADSDLLNFVTHYRHASSDVAAAAGAPSASASPLADAASGFATTQFVLGRLPALNARIVFYDAVRVAADDDHAAGSAFSSDVARQQAVAGALGLSAACSSRIATVARREQALEGRRRRLLMGDDASVIA